MLSIDAQLVLVVSVYVVHHCAPVVLIQLNLSQLIHGEFPWMQHCQGGVIGIVHELAHTEL